MTFRALECMTESGIIAKPLITQVAGRHGESSSNIRMLDIGQGYILKLVQPPPRGPREIHFYQTVFDSQTEKTDLLSLQHFLPKFYECITFDDASFLKLENITSKLQTPCVMDVKMGAITWDPLATENKIQQEKRKFPPSQTLGFRFSGFKIFSHESNSYDDFDKHYCYSLTEESIFDQGFRRFFSRASDMQHVIKIILSKLKHIEKWFLSQKMFAFYSSSLLLVYDSSSRTGNLSDKTDIKQISKIKQNHESEPARSDVLESSYQNLADVRMIDFAHVFPSDSLDENYLHGLRSVIHYLTRLLDI